MTDHYTYRVVWSAEDEAYCGTAAEWRGLSWIADTPETAFQGIRELIAESVQDCAEDGIPVPEPLADRAFSGKFQVRVPPELHRELVIEAAEQGVSLNRLISSRLSVVKREAVPTIAAERRARAKEVKPVRKAKPALRARVRVEG